MRSFFSRSKSKAARSSSSSLSAAPEVSSELKEEIQEPTIQEESVEVTIEESAQNDEKDEPIPTPMVVPPKMSSVYKEAMEMLSGALIIYLFADIRDIAREGSLGEAGVDDLQPPLTATDIWSKIEGQKEALAKRALDHDNLRDRLAQLQSLQQEQQNTGLFNSLMGGSSRSMKEPTTLTHFVDDNATEEIVHGIVVNHSKCRVTVIFRGSVTPKDFIQDAKCVQTKVENPVAPMVADPDHTTETINVHTGFYEYLFHEQPTKEPSDVPISRLDQIIKDVRGLLRQYPGYTLYCTGHSLGGALCTLFGFYASTDQTLMQLLHGRPVIVISVASPYVGNWKFRMAFSTLERMNKLKHLRLTNLEDMVTLLPFASPKATSLSPALSLIKGAGNLYKHVGMRLQFKANEEGEIEHSIQYPKDSNADDDEEYGKDVSDALDSGKSLARAFLAIVGRDFETVIKHHSCDEYEARLQKCQDGLTSATLEELYEDRSLVGKMMDEDYIPVKLESGYERTKRALAHWTRGSGAKSSSTVGDEGTAE
mmetsp:Transcript_9655/g.14201  ORF Transcript_9655/g.14201 Transcript_9655/m.14201 type:complete len:538 (-) Transcript_9655:218-1831(-)|eukprot:CAMPEP_0194049664 /NCGR_PEP_ID=MMETSP0009_2-20130614/30817_1 /TAXON_ID=210454 /ORGANISM="Grammatophora oceanica, Strain CCMP 410" /LENGTH=537 /DNA_ID=CAMNT_0038695871 /DNA_START=61 /DNA_END=1674 /DNA_ORIENTATION=+